MGDDSEGSMTISAGKKAIRFAAAAVAMAVSTVGLASPASAAVPGPADVRAAPWTPQLATSGTDGSVERVRQMVRCEGTMYAVGRFTDIRKGSTTYTRNNAFSFSATNGNLTSWNPNVDGQVNAIALNADCSTAYLGGSFTSINGTAVKNIAAVSTSTGNVLSTFAHSASGKVNTLALVGGHLLVGGNFTAINQSTKDYLVSLDPDDGRDDGYVNLNISGRYVYTDQGGRSSGNNSTNVYNFALSPDGTKLLAMGVFTSVGGEPRRQIVMLNLGATATVSPWYSPEFDQNCATVEPFWLQDASWSPDMSTIYIATTGYKPATNLNPYVGTGYFTSEPRGGLCDVAAAFPATPEPVLHDWVNHTGCDSLYSTAADANHVYIGGHQRWADSPNGCDGRGTQGIPAPGMGGLDPSQRAARLQPHQGTRTRRDRHGPVRRCRRRSVDLQRQPGQRQPVRR